MSRSKRQQEFTQAIGLLIAFAYSKGYGLTFGDAFRDPRAFKGAKPYGKYNSNHKKRLAVDFNLFKDGEYLDGDEAKHGHSILHTYWDTIGGNRRIPHDLNHYDFKE